MKSELLHMGGRDVRAVLTDAFEELQGVWRVLGFAEERSVIVILGGAGGMSAEDIANVQAFFENHLMPFAKEKKAVVIDGGTDSGVMAAVGKAQEKAGGDVPLVGVLARGVEGIMDMLEPHHTHFIFCPGINWGDESLWIAKAANILAGSQPSLAVVINGGQITWEDVRVNIEHGRPALIAEGSGRTADAIAQTRTGSAIEPKALPLIRTGRVHVANFFTSPQEFIRKMGELMKTKDGP